MHKIRAIITLLMSMFMVTAAYCQQKPEDHLVKDITGSVISTDAVGNIITIRTSDQKQMAFVVPDKAVITQETHTIGLMDIGKSDSVNIQYYFGAYSKNFVVSIVDTETVVNE